MAVSITYDGATPTVGADADVWGTELNVGALAKIKVDLDALATEANASETELTTATSNIVTLTTNLGLAAPIGSVVAWPRNTAPTNWLECSGQAVSRTTYATLFAITGTVFGVGNGTTTFNVPDLRGEFVRGWDNSRGVDSGRAFGSAQADELEAHTHLISPPSSSDTTSSGLTATGTGGGETVTPYESGSTGGTETRPRNIALMYIIRAL
jgi:phage-related tail fiber protein